MSESSSDKTQGGSVDAAPAPVKAKTPRKRKSGGKRRDAHDDIAPAE